MNVDDDDDYHENNVVKDNFNKDFNQRINTSSVTLDLDETPYPLYIQQMLINKRLKQVIDHGDEERGQWTSQFEYLLSCIGYVVGLGNIWRFPSRVYNGGGGAFLLPYFFFCVVVGVPMISLEMGLGQFCGQGCSKAFRCVPILFAQGWVIFIVVFLMIIPYTIIISYCLLYLVLSFKRILPWSVCTNSYNTDNCVNTSFIPSNSTNSTFLESSIIQFWNYYVTSQQKRDGSYYLITEPLGKPSLPVGLCIVVIISLSALIIMFGVKVSGKIIYLTVIFPYIAIFQFIILGCTLPGAANGIKFYLYPDIKKLLDPMVILSALEQLLFSSGIAAGGLLTMSSFNRFRDKIFRNVLIVILADFITSFISGFATFPILGYMAYRSGKNIEDIISADSSLFFITYPEALSNVSNSNLWSILFMSMAVLLGLDSLFILLETVIIAIADNWPCLHIQKNKIILTVSVSLLIFFICMFFITPGGGNWLLLYESRVSPFVLTFGAIMEVIIIAWFYGYKNYATDFEMMTGNQLNLYVSSVTFTFVPVCIFIVMILGALNSQPVEVHGHTFPRWTQLLAWIMIIVIISPLPIGIGYILVKYKIENPRLNLKDYFKECTNPPPAWGPRLKRYWTQSDFYSKKLVKYKNNEHFLRTLKKNENLDKLVNRSEKRIIKSQN